MKNKIKHLYIACIISFLWTFSIFGQDIEVVKGIPVRATQVEAEEGTNNTKLMTPLRTKQSISATPFTVSWGGIIGTLSTQTDLQSALNLKMDDTQATAFGLSLIDDADAPTARTTLGLGTLATQSGTFSGTSSGTNTGDQIVPANESGAANNFLSAYNSSNGVWTKVQPTWANINKTTSDIADITTKSHDSLSGTGTNSHVTIDSHLASVSNPHSVSKTQVGLGNVDNTSDVGKPVSTAQQTALDLKLDDSQVSAFGLTLIDDIDAATARTTLGIGAGDVGGPTASIDNEITLFSGVTGKTIKRATTTGILKATSGVIAAAVAGDFPTLNQNTTGNAATVTTNANLTGAITSVGNATSLGSFTSANLLTALTDETGTGVAVFGTAPTFTTSITSPLVIGGTGVTSDLSLQTTSGVGGDGADMHFLVGNNGATEAMTILNNGKVGIGTTAPEAPLDVSGINIVTNTANGNLNLRVTDAFAADIGAQILFKSKVDAVGTYGYQASIAGRREVATTGNHTGYLQFNTTNSSGTVAEKMRIASDGSVGIGTTTASAQLHTTGTVRFQNFGAGAASFDANGNVSSASDERLKTILGGFNDGLSQLLNINPILYKWNETSGLDMENTYAGFSAQNVAKWLPNAASINGDGILGVSDRVIIAALVNAVKDLSAEIDALKTKLALPVAHVAYVNADMTTLVKTKNAKHIEIEKPLLENAYEIVDEKKEWDLISNVKLKKGYWEKEGKIYRLENQIEAENRRQMVIESINLN